MISIKKLKEKDKGRWVVFTQNIGPAEEGRIKSWNDELVFVVYSCNGEWDKYRDYTGVPTYPEDLTLIKPPML